MVGNAHHELLPHRPERLSVGSCPQMTVATDPKAGRYLLIENYAIVFDEALALHLLSVERFP